MKYIIRLTLKVLLFASVALVTLASVAGQNKSQLVYIGNATDLENPGQLLYREYHTVLLVNNRPYQRRVEYFDAEGKPIATKTNWYKDNIAQPEFELVDLRRNYREQLRQKNGKYQLILTENGKKQSSQIKINSGDDTDSPDYPLVIDAGFDEYVRQHWQALNQGRTIPFSFASVARQDSINFEIRKIDNKNKPNVLKLEMSLASAWLSWLMEPIELEYDQQSRRLLSYRGLSNISDNNGEGQTVIIHYQYMTQGSASVNNDSSQ